MKAVAGEDGGVVKEIFLPKKLFTDLREPPEVCWTGMWVSGRGSLGVGVRSDDFRAE